ncbi:MAG: hypothetical protein HC848_02060 [Limnobacter sp.]|nr:hypothetical protein [Limnobacter sp.]
MKILTQSNKLVFFKELAKLQSVVPVFVLFATLIMLWAAASQVHAVLGIKEAERSIATLPKFTVVRKKGDLAMYEEYAQVLGRISPSVAVKVVPEWHTGKHCFGPVFS